MPIPPYLKFIEPTLRYLAPPSARSQNPRRLRSGATELGLSEDEKLQTYRSGDTVYKNRTRFAHDRLKSAGLSSSPQMHFWQLTNTGIAYANQNEAPLSDGQVRQIDRAREAARSPRGIENDPDLQEPDASGIDARGDIAASPDDRFERALSELTASAARDLLEGIGRASPTFFETLVLDLLHAMGYGASRADLQHVGQPGDAGIDGIISLDRLGLEKVYVQAKRWQNSVARTSSSVLWRACGPARHERRVHHNVSVYCPRARVRKERREDCLDRR